MSKIIYTYHKRRSTQTELVVCAGLKEQLELENINPVIWSFNSLAKIYNVKNGMTLDGIYDLEKVDEYTASLWHKKITGERDRKVMTIEVIRGN